jgi:hypothetical protein
MRTPAVAWTPATSDQASWTTLRFEEFLELRYTETLIAPARATAASCYLRYVVPGAWAAATSAMAETGCVSAIRHPDVVE